MSRIDLALEALQKGFISKEEYAGIALKEGVISKEEHDSVVGVQSNRIPPTPPPAKELQFNVPRAGTTPEPLGASLPQEIAFHAERILGPKLREAAKQPENLQLLNEQQLRKAHMPYPGAVAAMTDLNNVALGALANPVIGAIARPVIKPIGAVLKPLAEKAIGKFSGVLERAAADRAKKAAIKEMLSPKPTPGKVLPINPPTPSTVIVPGSAPATTPQIIVPWKFVPPPVAPIPQGASPTPRIDSMIGSRNLVGNAKQSVSETLGNLKTQWIDKYAPLQPIVQKAEEILGKPLKFEQDPYKAARLYSGVAGKVENRLDVLSNILAPVRGDLKNLERFMLGHRSIERAGRGFANPSDISSGEARAEIGNLRKAVGPERMKAIEDAFYRIRTEVGDDILNNLEKSGVISKGQRAGIKEKNDFWVPFDVLEHIVDNEHAVPLGRQSLSVTSQDVVRGLVGTKKLIRSPLESLISRMYKSVEVSERNMVVRKMAALGDIPGMEGLIVKGKSIPTGYEKVGYYNNGVKSEMALPKAVADSINGMNQYSADFITRMGSISAQGMRLMSTTLNIPFALFRNPIRDFQTASITTGKGPLFADWWLKGFFGAIRSDADYIAMKEAGGSMSGFSSSISAPAKTLSQVTDSKLTRFAKTITNPFELIRTAGTALENAPRLGVYKLSRSKGLSESASALASREGTVDFSKSGTFGKLLNMWVPFLNARGQGSLILGKALKDKPSASIMNIASTVWMPAYATYTYNREHFADLYAQIPEYEKENNFIVVLGSEKDKNGVVLPKYIRIPKGDVGRIFGNPLEFAMQWADKTGRKSVFSLGLKMLSDISPVEFEYEGKFSPTRLGGGVLPPLLKAGVETGLGKNIYFQNDVVPKSLKSAKTKSLQYTDRTAKSMVWLGKQTGLSPMVLENFFRTSLGSGIFQVLEPQNIPKQFKTAVVQVRGGANAEDIYDFKQDVRGDKADIRIRMSHALIDMLSGDDKAQDAAMAELSSIRLQVPSKERKDFMRYQVQTIMGRALPPEARALRSLTPKERKQYVIQKATGQRSGAK